MSRLRANYFSGVHLTCEPHEHELLVRARRDNLRFRLHVGYIIFEGGGGGDDVDVVDGLVRRSSSVEE